MTVKKEINSIVTKLLNKPVSAIPLSDMPAAYIEAFEKFYVNVNIDYSLARNINPVLVKTEIIPSQARILLSKRFRKLDPQYNETGVEAVTRVVYERVGTDKKVKATREIIKDQE
jgi:hypothetical protein